MWEAIRLGWASAGAAALSPWGTAASPGPSQIGLPAPASPLPGPTQYFGDWTEINTPSLSHVPAPTGDGVTMGAATSTSLISVPSAHPCRQGHVMEAPAPDSEHPAAGRSGRVLQDLPGSAPARNGPAWGSATHLLGLLRALVQGSTRGALTWLLPLQCPQGATLPTVENH